MSYLASLSLTLPELILSLGGIVTMLVAAFAGDKSARLINGLSILLLIVAAIVATQSSGIAFGGQYTADAFAAFAKVLTFGAAAVALLLAPRWFGQEDALRAEYPVLVLFAAAGICRDRAQLVGRLCPREFRPEG
jgi:NADH-quinone oxidoreductase subunit N